MWAQLITFNLKPGHEQDVSAMMATLRSVEQEDSGLLRSMVLRDQADPATHHVLVLFESQEKARVREADPRRAEGLDAARTLMEQSLAGPPAFANLDVVYDA